MPCGERANARPCPGKNPAERSFWRDSFWREYILVKGIKKQNQPRRALFFEICTFLTWYKNWTRSPSHPGSTSYYHSHSNAHVHFPSLFSIKVGHRAKLWYPWNMLSLIDSHMCACETSRTPDSSRPQTFRHLRDCLRSESSYCADRHTCCSPSYIAFEWSICTRHHQRALAWSRCVVWEARYPIWGRSLNKNFGHVRDMVDF